MKKSRILNVYTLCGPLSLLVLDLILVSALIGQI